MPFDGTTLEPWQQALLKAADLLRERGWCQGKITDGPKLCMAGAINMAVYGVAAPNRFTAAEGVVMRARLAVRRATGWELVSVWNDNCARTADEAISMLERAAGLVSVEA